MTAFEAARVVATVTTVIEAPTERVFPLLCPVREEEWLPGWEAEILHSESGIAELGCVFRTDLAGRGVGTWVCTRYEPTRHIEFATFWSAGAVDRLALTLAERRGGCSLTWHRELVGLDDTGNRYLADQDIDVVAARLRHAGEVLAHYCATGRRWSPGSS